MAQIRPIRDVLLSFLRISGPLPCSLLRSWFKHFYQIELTTGALRMLSDQNYIFYDQESGYCFLYRGQKIDAGAEMCFYVMQKMFVNSQDTVVRARYPFDYLFTQGEKEYLLIDFEHNGEQKMRVLNAMDNTNNLGNGFIPVIVKLADNNSFENCDEKGNRLFIPKNDYVLANVTYNLKLPEGGRYRAIISEIKRDLI